MQTAISLAAYKASKEARDKGGLIEVEKEDIEKVVNVSRKFKDYMERITKHDEDGRAAMRYDRPATETQAAKEARNSMTRQ